MGIKSSLRKALMILAILSMAAPVSAGVPALEPLNYKLKYDVTWNGFTIGRLRIRVSEDAFSYRVSIDTKTSGIARLFSSEKSVAIAEGRVVDGRYIPTKYTSRGDNGSRQRTVITYDASGAIATRDRKPPITGKSRKEVPLEQANAATDPASAFFILRKKLHTAMKANVRDVSTHTYDGVRFAEMLIHVVSPARVEVFDKYENAINTVITRKPLNGYSAKELKKFKEGDPPAHIYFSTDGRFMPLKAQVQTNIGTIAATLSEIQ